MASENAIVIACASWLPAHEWRAAPESLRTSYLTWTAEAALARKRRELMRGVDVANEPLTPVRPRSRPDGATGPPLDPHRERSRIYRLASYAIGKSHITVYWPGKWSMIVGAHRTGARGRLPVRDVVGLTPGGLRWLKGAARSHWRRLTGFGGPAPAALAHPAFPRPGARPRPIVPAARP